MHRMAPMSASFSSVHDASYATHVSVVPVHVCVGSVDDPQRDETKSGNFNELKKKEMKEGNSGSKHRSMMQRGQNDWETVET